MKLAATQRILVRLACTMEPEQLQEFMSAGGAPPSVREKFSLSTIGYLLWLKEKYSTVKTFLRYIEDAFSNLGFTTLIGIVREHLINCEEGDLTRIPKGEPSSWSSTKHSICLGRTLFAMKDYINSRHLTIMIAVSPIHKIVKENISTTLDLFEKMRECGCICENDVQYLKELLEELKLVKPLQLLLSYERWRYQPGSSQGPAMVPCPSVLPTELRVETSGLQHPLEGPINNCRRETGEGTHSGTNLTHKTMYDTDDEYVSASGSPFPSQNIKSNIHVPATPPSHSTSLSTNKNVHSSPRHNTSPKDTQTTESAHFSTHRISSNSQQQPAVSTHSCEISPVASAPRLEVLQLPGQNNQPKLNSREVGGNFSQQWNPITNLTPLSSYCGSGDVFCCQPVERQNAIPGRVIGVTGCGGLFSETTEHQQAQEGELLSISSPKKGAGCNKILTVMNSLSTSSNLSTSLRQATLSSTAGNVTYNPASGISSPSMVSGHHGSSCAPESSSENRVADVRSNSLNSSLQLRTGRHEVNQFGSVSESGRSIAQSTSSPTKVNICFPPGKSHIYPILPSVESSSSEEEEAQVEQKKRKNRLVTRLHSKKLKLNRHGMRSGAGVKDDKRAVESESGDDYHTPPEGD